jgi:phosphohistidine phosphatase
MKLNFLRHGLAADRELWEGDDFDRPLTDEGILRMQKQAKQMECLNLKLGKILSSPLKRARQTAQIVAEQFGLADSLFEDQRLSPGFGIPELAQILQDHAALDALIVVGHEPDFSEVVSRLIGGGRIVFKKGGLAQVDVLDPIIPSGKLNWLFTPKSMDRLAMKGK